MTRRTRSRLFRVASRSPRIRRLSKGEKFKPSDKYEPIEPDDPLLAKLGDKWRAMLTAADYAAAHGGDRSRAEIAFAAVAMRAGIDDARSRVA